MGSKISFFHVPCMLTYIYSQNYAIWKLFLTCNWTRPSVSCKLFLTCNCIYFCILICSWIRMFFQTMSLFVNSPCSNGLSLMYSSTRGLMWSEGLSLCKGSSRWDCGWSGDSLSWPSLWHFLTFLLNHLLYIWLCGCLGGTTIPFSLLRRRGLVRSLHACLESLEGLDWGQCTFLSEWLFSLSLWMSLEFLWVLLPSCWP